VKKNAMIAGELRIERHVQMAMASTVGTPAMGGERVPSSSRMRRVPPFSVNLGSGQER
jgi:hypothetical protein